MLIIENFSFGYKKNIPIIKNINMSLPQGISLLVGENGSGKTTLLNCITGVLKGSGDIELDGYNCGSTEYSRVISYLPQRFDVYPVLKVREILTFIGELKGISKDRIKGEVDRVADKANIGSYLGTTFKKCSEGIQRRVGIAAALLGDPKLVILDEPTAGVDPQERRRFYQNVKECFSGKIVIVSTHILDDIESLADRVIMLTKGQIACNLPYNDFMDSLGKPATLNELWQYYQEHTDNEME